MRKFLFYILFIFFIFEIQVQNSGCANIVPPEGGYRDSIPPLLVKVSPPDSSKGFQEKTITFTFDEFVDLNNYRENLIVSPVPKNIPDLQAKLRTITMKIKDSLEPNTTYTFNFGNVIKDINEGNLLKDFAYIFTTGQAFDSLTLTGKVISAETGKPDSTVTVMLYTNPDDSATINENPRYITRPDKNGNFSFRNLPAATFYVYATKSEGGSFRYSRDKFAFAEKSVNTTGEKEPVILYAYKEFESKITLPPMSISKAIKGGGDKRLKPVVNTSTTQLDLLSDFTMTFDQPLKLLDTSKMHLSTDSTFNPVRNYRTTLDSTRKKITITNNWVENTLYNLIVEKDFAEDSLDRKLLKTDTFSFKTRKLSEYAAVKIRFKNIDLTENPVLLFMQNETLIKSIPMTSNEVSIPLFLPGEYELRILKDRNKNGKWDPGQFFDKHLQPEIVIPITRRINVKANWDNEFDIALQ